MMPPRCAAPPTADLAVRFSFIVADDDATVSTMIARVIARTYRDAAIRIVSNGQEALREYEQHGADLIVTDRNMPDMDGLSLTRCIRAKDVDVPIVLVTGVGGSRSEAVAVGVTQVLDKPFGISQLVMMLTALLPLAPELWYKLCD